MRHNCSLQDLKIPKTRFRDEKSIVYPVNFISIQNTPTSTLNLDAIEQQIQDKTRVQPLVETKSVQKCLSQKNIDLPVMRFQLVSPKDNNQACAGIEKLKKVENGKK